MKKEHGGRAGGREDIKKRRRVDERSRRSENMAKIGGKREKKEEKRGKGGKASQGRGVCVNTQR